MGTLIGLLVGLIFYGIHRWLPTTTSIEIVLTLVTPYCMYYFAEHFHFSGVLAVVSGGLFLSSKRQSMLNYRSRIEGVNVWTSIVFVLNGLIFLLIGLQLPSIVQQLGDVSLTKAIGYGLTISIALILSRLVCAFSASIFTRFMSHFITVADAKPGRKYPLITGWAGMRGGVSLAAALSVPLLTQEGQPFPYRNLILFITFVVILVTLVIQGLTLPWLIRKINLEDKYNVIPEDRQEFIIQKKLAQSSLQFLEEEYGKERVQNEYLNNLFAKLQIDLNFIQRDYEEFGNPPGVTLSRYQSIYLELLGKQRHILTEINRISDFDEELIRKYHSLIDIEEFRIRESQLQKF